jgi:hypothetical protein
MRPMAFRNLAHLSLLSASGYVALPWVKPDERNLAVDIT